ncbi:hypothetical protein PILCRDRAFT_429998 [Piloderma croceum F 1598]|uniref:Uncharacterized protein n=1 Tax=Piloderma croceum (strain F 1598) TaxID=765440 RepID=A0A0C3BBE7_PILCF|nr:hypothetical protein PILCRDRAFT_429998 [Piloderma croceum F 1598]
MGMFIVDGTSKEAQSGIWTGSLPRISSCLTEATLRRRRRADVGVDESAGDAGEGFKVGLLVGGWIKLSKYQVWDALRLSHIPHKPTYTRHSSFPVRRVLWRPGYECELAIVLNEGFGSGSGSGGGGSTLGWG